MSKKKKKQKKQCKKALEILLSLKTIYDFLKAIYEIVIALAEHFKD